MYPKIILASTLTLSIISAPLAFAQGNSDKPPVVSSVTLDAQPGALIHGQTTTLSGKVTGDKNLSLRVEEDTTFPYGDVYTPTSTTVTANNGGNYSVTIKPRVNTQYRVATLSTPSVVSNARMIWVRTSVSVAVSDNTPKRGRLVRFSGKVSPAHDGQRVQLQRRSSTGRWVTIVRPLLQDTGLDDSSYSRRIRIYKDGTYRIRFSSDAEHRAGTSNTVFIDTHK